MMRVLHKSWGVKTELFKNDLCEVSILQLEAGQRCSWHRHRSKWNQFYVISGELVVKTEDGTTRIGTGKVFTTNPMQWHEFQTPGGPAVVQEVMYVRYEAEDIERTVKGGKLECQHDWEDQTQYSDKNYVSVCRLCGSIKAVPKVSLMSEVRKCGEDDYLPTSQRG